MIKNQFVFSNIDIRPDFAYVLSVAHNGKVHPLTNMLVPVLEAEYKRPVKQIVFSPQFLTDSEIGVINPKLRELQQTAGAKDSDVAYFAIEDFNQAVSDSDDTQRVINQILSQQDELVVNIYKNSGTLNLPEQTVVLGPNGKLVDTIDDKLAQRELLVAPLGLPIPRTFRAESLDELAHLYSEHFLTGSAFVMNPYSSSGSGTETVHSLEDIYASAKIQKANRFLLSDLLTIVNSPSVLSIIDDKQVLPVGLSDQVLDGVHYLGNASPSTATSKQQKDMLEMTREIGFKLQEMDYRGPFGVDYMIDDSGNVYFTEVNPRIIGATPDLARAHLLVNRGQPSITELVYRAIKFGNMGVSESQLTMPQTYWVSQAVKSKPGETITYQPTGVTNPRITISEAHAPGAKFFDARVAAKISYDNGLHPMSRIDMSEQVLKHKAYFTRDMDLQNV